MGEALPSPDAYLDATFSEGGYLSRAFPGYRPRAGQVALARAVDRAIVEKKNLLSEAGTGVGKSLGYSIPATYHAARNERTVVIVTANNALAEQLIGKDLPMLQRVVPWKFSFALLKGRGHYLCADRIERSRHEAIAQRELNLPDQEKKHLKIVQDWAEDCAAAGPPRWSEDGLVCEGGETGDRSELPFEPSHAIWKRFSVEADECKKSRCKHKNRCFPNVAQGQARKSRVIVTNYHMVYAHMRLVMDRGIYAVLPPFDVCVMDECFVAGTMIGKTPIEQIRVGDTVPSFDELSGSFTERKVTRLFVSRPSSLVRVIIGNVEIVCTSSHPFLTSTGWVNAINLAGAMVVNEKNNNNHELRSMRRNGLRIWCENAALPLTEPGLLLTRTCAGTQDKIVTGVEQETCSHKFQEIFRSNEVKEPNDVERCTNKSFDIASCNGLETSNKGRQRNDRTSIATDVGGRAKLAMRGCNTDRRENSKTKTNMLQDRYREQGEHDRDRSGRLESSVVTHETTRYTEGNVSSFLRVDRVEVLEQTSDGTFGGMCPDGLVYNLEVEGTHTYIVDGIVVHNCHEASPIARDTFGFQITQEGIRRLANKIYDEDPILCGKVEDAATWFFHAMLSLKKDERRYKARLNGDYLNEEMQAWEALVKGVAEVHGLLARRVDTLQNELNEGPDEDLENEVGEAEVLATRAATLLTNLKAVANPELDEHHAYYLEEDQKSRIAIAAKLVNPGDALRPGLFMQDADPEDSDRGKITVIATSATVATGTGSFDFIAHELGMPEGYLTLLAESPFDWANQCLFVCPSEMPEPNSPDFRDAVARTLEQIIRDAGGRTLGLFTSRRVLEHVHSALVGPCRKMGFTLLKQGDAPRGKLLEQFKRDITSVLVATQSFWAGVDVPGEALSVVVMDRLPFPSPDDPIAAALNANDDKSFWHYNVPRAIIEFKQGAGRLIRSDACRGVIVCLDNRLLTKRYAKEFLRALPEAIPKTRRLGAIKEWFNPPSWED